jgi:hypothetical protein
MPDSTVIISGSSRLNGSASVIANYLKDNYHTNNAHKNRFNRHHIRQFTIKWQRQRD